jgi:integrase
MAGRSINALLERLGCLESAKPHGFRAMFSTYFNNAHWNPDIIEAYLAHKPRDEIRAKYNRATHLSQRREMMQHWADHLDSLAAGVSVVTIRPKVVYPSAPTPSIMTPGA